MGVATNVTTLMSGDPEFDGRLCKKWLSIQPLLVEYTTIKEIDLALANMYKHDLAGLLQHHLEIPSEFVYPTILANGLVSSSQYDGITTKICLVENSLLDTFYTLFTEN